MGQLNGYRTKIGGKELVVSPYTQGIMEAFEEWQIDRVLDRALKSASGYRKRARQLKRDMDTLREDGIEKIDTLKADPKKLAEYSAKATSDYMDMNLEMLALETDARKAVDDVNKDAAAGVFGFYGEHCTKARRFPDGVEYLFMLCASPKMSLDDVKEMSKEHYGTMMKALARANGEEPKNENPGAPTSGSESTTSAPVNPSIPQSGEGQSEAA
jgi:hypothetical protein